MYDFAIIGGGLVGLGVAHALSERLPFARLLILDKESRVGSHQSGRNSGVLHSGIYYPPGSLKARLARAGNARMVRFCREHGIPHEICGKLVVATEERELAGLAALRQRAAANGVAVRRLGPEEAREIEPHLRCLAALHVPSTGIADFKQVAQKLAELLQQRGVDLCLGTRVERIVGRRASCQTLETDRGVYHARRVVNCAGLFSDRLARTDGAHTGPRIVPFRGEYYELIPERRHLVRNLIYPVPDPRFPFLGVHLTRGIDGAVHLGPNAVLSLKREGYGRGSFNLRDAAESLFYPGFWRFAARHWTAGCAEMARSFSKTLFLRSARRLLPQLERADLQPAPAGVRAQALSESGELLSDFHLVARGRSLHVCNAPSPAATCSLVIGAHVAEALCAAESAPRHSRSAAETPWKGRPAPFFSAPAAASSNSSPRTIRA